jgi:hypothetical protein
MSRHRSTDRSGVSRILAVLVVAALAVGAMVWGAWVLVGPADGGDTEQTAGSDDSAGPGPSADPCSGVAAETVTVWVAPGATDVVSQVAEGLQGCVTYDVVSTPSQQGYAELSDGAAGPDVWVPDNTLWTDLAEGLGADLEVGPVLATSPVVLTGPSDFVEQLTEDTSEDGGTAWGELLALEQQPVLVGDLTQDAASLAMVTSVDARLSVAVTPEQQDAVLVSLAQRALDGDPVQAAQGATDMLVPASEQAVAELGGDADLGVLVPQGGAGQLTYTALTLGEEPGRGAQVLADALADEAAQDVWREAGLRPGGDSETALVADVPADDAAAALVEPDRAQGLIQQWAAVAPNSRMLVLIDVSGSMDEVVDPSGASRFDLTMDASGEALQTLPPRTQLGLWWFSTNRGEDGQDWVEALPVRSMDAEVDGATQRERLLEITQSLDEEHTTGDTGLHDSLFAAYEQMQADFDPDYRNSIVLLTDGVNDDPDGGMSQEELISRLRDLQDEDRPVDVVIIGMGPDMEAGPMEEIADSVGGSFRQVQEATDIGPVLVSIIAAREAT